MDAVASAPSENSKIENTAFTTPLGSFKLLKTIFSKNPNTPALDILRVRGTRVFGSTIPGSDHESIRSALRCTYETNAGCRDKHRTERIANSAVD